LRDRYKVLGILGKGGFGATFVVADLCVRNKSYCVVKQLRPSNQEPSVLKMAMQLFEREAQTLSKIGDHPQVPKLLDYFEENQNFYLVQEYVRGPNLHQEVKNTGPFSELGARQFLSEILPILQYVHSQRMIHRDIKPGNIIRRESDRQLVLIDFGAVTHQVNSVANTRGSGQTAFTSFSVGTAGFAPPEQIAMRPVYASDIYAVGVTCLYLLTAKTPKDMGWNASTGELSWEQHVTLSEPLMRILRLMLELSVRDRYKSVEEVLHHLELIPYSESLAEGMLSSPLSVPKLDRHSGKFPAASTRLYKSGPLASSPVSPAMTAKPHAIPAKRKPLSPLPPSRPSLSTANLAAKPARSPNFQLAQKPKSHKDQLASGDSLSGKSKAPVNGKSLVEAYAKGRRDFAQQNLTNLYLPKANLPKINLYQTQLNKANLQEANLSGADLGRSDLSQALLKNANLSQTYLGYANLTGADLRGANLSSAHLKYANLQGANLCGANLTDAQVSQEQLAQAKTNWMTILPNGKRGLWG
jgi:serine/threonine-protein kinase